MKKVTTPPRTSRPTVEPRSVILKKPSRPGLPPAVVWVLTRSPKQNRRSRVNTPCGTGRTVTSLCVVDLRDDQPMKHEIGNRTYIVADVEPLDVDGVRTVEVGTRALADRLRRAAAVLRPARGRRAHLVAVDLPGRLRARAVRPGVLPPPQARPRPTARRARSRRGPAAEPGRAAQKLSTSSSLRVSKTGSGSGWGSCFLASRTSEWAPQPWSKRDHPAVVVGVAVGADAEGVGERAGDADQEAAAAAVVAGRTGRAATSGPPSPSYQRWAASSRPSTREGADPAEAEVLGDLADLGLVVGVERVVAEGVRRDQPRVVVARPGSRSPGERSPGWIRSR